MYDTIILHNYSNLYNNIITIFINMWSSELGMLYVMFIEWNNIPLITPTELLRAASPCFSLRNEHKKKKWQLHSRIDEIHLGLESRKLNEKSRDDSHVGASVNHYMTVSFVIHEHAYLKKKKQCTFLSKLSIFYCKINFM